MASPRTVSDVKAYLRALQGVKWPLSGISASIHFLENLVQEWSQSPPPGLEVEDLCSVAWLHEDTEAFSWLASRVSPSVHLLLVMQEEVETTREMLEQWNEVGPGLMGESLKPWRHCLATLALDARIRAPQRAILATLDINACLPANRADVAHWLWKPGPVENPRGAWTYPLHLALRCGDFDTAQWLIERGADPWSKDSEECNALDKLDEGRAHMERLVGILKKPLPLSAHWDEFRDRLHSQMQADVLEVGTNETDPNAFTTRRL